MRYLFTPNEVKEMEKATVKHGVSEREMIVHASKALYAWVLPYVRAFKQPKVLVVCGKGNNGADGYALASLLRKDCIQTDILSADTGRQTAENEYFSSDQETLANFPEFKDYTLIVDAIYGSGFHGIAPAHIEELIEKINDSHRTVLSVDLPSGVNGATGQVEGIAIRASETMNLSAFKRGAFIFPGAGRCGKQVLLGADLSEGRLSNCAFLDAVHLPPRCQRSNKGTYGTVGIVAGSKNMAGAAYLAAKSAYLCGAGLVKIITEECNRVILQTLLPEAILYTYDDQTPLWEILNAINGCTSAVVGPGLGRKDKQRELVHGFLMHCSLPLILDADGLNLAAGTDLVKNYKGSAVLTPHPAEASRLLKIPVEEILSSPLDALATLCSVFSCTVLLKDAHTLVGDGKKVYVNLTGNNGMSTGGCGDVLSGILGALLYGCDEPAMAAATGAYIHGCAGDLAEKEHGKRSMLASHVMNSIETVLKSL